MSTPTWLETMLAQSNNTQSQNKPTPEVPKPLAVRPEGLSSGGDESNLESILTFGTEGHPFKNGPDSGSILKVLSADTGVRERILQGSKKGHVFQIIHMPGSKNFFLCENWEEDSKDPETGEIRKVPKKRYDPFLITNPEPVSQKTARNSLDLLKAKFSQPRSIPRQSPPPPTPSLSKEGAPEQSVPIETKEAPQNPSEKLLSTVYGEKREEWNVAKNIPFEAFLHPENFSWGNSNEERTLEDYPAKSRVLRDKMMPVMERLSHQEGVDLSTLTLGQAIEQAEKLNLLV